MHDAQSQSGPLSGVLRREEGLEDPIQMLRRDPSAVVRESQLHGIVFDPPGDLEATGLRAVGRLDGILGQGKEYLLEIPFVGADERQGIELRFQDDPGLPCAVLEQAHDAAGHGCEDHIGHGPVRGLLREAADPLDDGLSTIHEMLI